MDNQDMVMALLKTLCSDLDQEKIERIVKRVDEIFVAECTKQEAIMVCCFFLTQAKRDLPILAQVLFSDAIKYIVDVEK